MKLLTIIGTRPEAVKMAPVLRALGERRELRSLLCATGQHQQLFDEPSSFFALRHDFSLNLMHPDQQPAQFESRALLALDRLLAAERPDRVLVHGDTSSAVAGALAANNRGIKVAHVEAGLRTHRLDNPWPEEGHRLTIDAIADQLFAPTPAAARNLDREQAQGAVFVTGNSGVDALHLILAALARDPALRSRCDAALPRLAPGKRVLLATLHRRESIGAPFAGICAALRAVAAGGIQLVVPLHPNPSVRRQLADALGGRAGVHLVEPFSLPAMVRMMQRADLILTDSGGVQEEAPSLGKPVLVAREVTERPEGVQAGLARVVGSCPERIVSEVEAALVSPLRQVAANPYGDGAAAGRIVAGLLGEDFAPFAAETSLDQGAPLRMAG